MFLWILAAVVIVLALYALYMFYKKRRVTEEEKEPCVPPHILALNRLERARLMTRSNFEQIQAYYTEVSNTVRYYIESRFGLRAPERTTEEFFFEISGRDIFNNETKALLKDFLKSSDMVKFAKYGPSNREMEEAYSTAKKFVTETADAEI